MPWAVGLLGVLLYHRFTLRSGLDLVQADIGDSRFIAFVLEHWHRVAQGARSWRSPPIFYPVRGTLGYSDALIGMGMVHAVLRQAGLGVFAAMNAQLILWSGLSFAACVAFLRRGFGFGAGAACAGGYFYAFGWPRYAQLVHVQLQFTSLLPVMALLALLVLRDGAGMGRWRAFGLLAALAMLFALLLATTTYFALFFALALVLAVALCMATPASRQSIGRVARRQALPLGGALLLLGVLLVPVWAIYAPVVRAGGGRTWSEVASYLADPADLVWLGRENFVWGWLAERFPDRASHNWPELRIGVGLVVGAAWLGIIGWEIRAAWLGRSQATTVVVLTGALLQLAMLRLPGGGSLWWLVYQGMPGMGGIRAVPRLELVVMLPMALAVAMVTDALWRAGARRRWLRPALLAALAVGAAEQLGTSELYSGRQAEALAHVVASAVPKECLAFEVVGPATPLGPAEAPFRGALSYFYRYTTLLAADFAGKPEVGGLSGWTPPGYGLDDPLAPDGAARLEGWLARNAVAPDRVCVIPLRLRFTDLPEWTGRLWP